MNKQHILLIITVLATISMVSCKQKTIMTTEKSHNERFFLAPDTAKGALNIEITVELPVCYDNQTILDSIRNTIVSNLFGYKYISYSNDSIVSLFVKDLTLEYKQANEPMLEQLDSTALYSFNNEHILEGFSLLNDEHIYSYGINRYVFMGGAHGLSNRNYFNFNLTTGKLISETDLFNDDYRKKLIEIIKTRIVEQSNEDPDAKTIINLEDTDYWVEAIKPNNNFYITDESINYVFNPYEIAPYYMGITEVVLPFDRLNTLIKASSPIQYLVELKKTNIVQ